MHGTAWGVGGSGRGGGGGGIFSLFFSTMIWKCNGGGGGGGGIFSLFVFLYNDLKMQWAQDQISCQLCYHIKATPHPKALDSKLKEMFLLFLMH